MKSRTSSFNPTVFKKDCTRFAPAWGCYLIALLLGLISLTDAGASYYRIQVIGNLISVMAWVNMIYAAVVAQLLFGDLYNSRLCNALHALPVTRDGWFVTHTAAGLAFALVPNLVALPALPMMKLGAGWSAGLWWLLAADLQYLFFFGVAVLCLMMTGNRLGQAALYILVNFVGYLAYWMATSLYEPLLYGIQIPEEPFVVISPLVEMSQLSGVFSIDCERIMDDMGSFSHYEVYGVAPGEGWGYMAICAILGVLALAAALVLYRKRKLEYAGDFVAFRILEPVALILATVFGGGFFHLFSDAFFGLNLQYVLLAVGMVVCFFACQMLLERSTRVFRKKTFLGCGAIMAVFALTLVLTYFDPVGVTRYMPEADEVESITFSRGYSVYRHEDFPFEATEIEDIEAILGVHEDCIDRSANTIRVAGEAVYSPFNLRLEYKLKNGRTVNRFYDVHPLSEAGQVLKDYFTRPECVLGFPAEKAPEMADYIFSIYTDSREGYRTDLEGLDVEEMLSAIVADCQAGNMAQVSGFHYPNGVTTVDPLEDETYDDVIAYIEIGWDHEALETAMQGNSESVGILSYTHIRVYRSCTNTLKWLEDNDLLTEEQHNELGGVTATFTTG